MQRNNLAVGVKLWALICVIIGVSLTINMMLTCVLTGIGFVYLVVQKNWRLLRSFGIFYLLLALLLYLIRFHGPVSYTHLDVYKRQIQAAEMSYTT